MRKSLPIAVLALLTLSLRAEEKPVPRLAVVISVDQMRADYLVRFRPYFGEGGFKRLLEGGADYQNCHYQHALTITAPGHATILSGVNANVHGIIANEWMDPQTLIQGNAVEDRDSPLVGLPSRVDRYANATFAAKAGRSPRNFLGTTVGDRLKARYGAAAKVFGVADKDRSAILMAGARADGAYWTEEGRFVTSTYYRPALPAWIQEFNATHGAWHKFGQMWDRALDKSVYDAVQGPDEAPGEQADNGLGITFPRRVDGGRTEISNAFYGAFDQTPWNNEMVTALAERFIEVEQLGADATPDLLCVGFAQTDAVGHAYGPDSHEVMDAYVRLDRVLAEFFAFLERKVGLKNCVIVLTADHGVSPLPETMQAKQGPEAGGRVDSAETRRKFKESLDVAFGPLPGDLVWFTSDASGWRLNAAALQARDLPAARVAAELKVAVLRDPRFAAAYTREELVGPGPLDAWGEMMRRSYFPARSPEVMYVLRDGYQTRKLGTGHGTPYDHDTHVPQLWLGAGVKAGVHAERVGVEDLAPTLAGLLGVDLPEAKGKRLF